VPDITLVIVSISIPSDFKIWFDSIDIHTVDSIDIATCFYFKFTFEKEKLMNGYPVVGLRIDVDELGKNPSIALWGRFIREDRTYSPYTKLWEAPINLSMLEEIEDTIADAYITIG